MYVSKSQKFAIISTMSAVRGEVMVIKGLANAAHPVWENFRDAATQAHLIERVAFSNLKSESLKSFGAALLKLTLNAKGKTLNGYSDQMIVEESERFTSTLSRLGSVKELTFEHAFATLMSTVVGYDIVLVREIMAMNETPMDIAHLTYRYVVRKFDLAEPDYAEVMLNGSITDEHAESMEHNRESHWDQAYDAIRDVDFIDPFDMLKEIVKVNVALKPLN